MAEQPVRVTYDIRGAREGAAAVDELKRATLEHGQATEGAGRSAEGYERAVGNVRGQVEQLKQSQEAANRATVAAGQGFEQATRRSVELAQRFAGLANHAAELSRAMGGGSAGAAVGLAGSLAAGAAQGAALGAALGPVGAGLGAVIGGAIPVISSLASGVDTAAISFENLEANTRAAHTRLVEVRDTAPEVEEAVRRISTMLEAIDSFDPSWATIATPGTFRSITDVIGSLGLDRDPPTGRGGRGRRPRAAAAEEPVDDGAFLERTGAEAEAEGLRRLAEENERAAAEAADAEAERQRAKSEAADLFEADQEKRHERELERIAMERRARENLDRANMERLAQQTELLESIGDRIGGVFAGAFSAAIQGQEDFGQALAKGTKQVLIQFGTQMVAEGIGALFTGIGNTVLNPPAAATKLAEGAGKIALGVGLGAAGAAIPTGGASASSGRAERPRVDQAPSSGAQAQQLVINLNAPTVLGGTEAEFGRVMLRAGEAAARRFHGGRG